MATTTTDKGLEALAAVKSARTLVARLDDQLAPHRLSPPSREDVRDDLNVIECLLSRAARLLRDPDPEE